MKARLKDASTEEKLRHNAWELTGLADPGKPVVVPDLLAQRGWTDLDYLKIDIDGADFEILQSFEGSLRHAGPASPSSSRSTFSAPAQPDEHSFHNTDRFMRGQGFDLFRLDVRNCSTRALPARYVWPTPAETVSGPAVPGRGLLRARRAGAPSRRAGARLSAEKIAKLAAVFAAWDVPDAAAELITSRRATLAPLFDVDAGLDLLAAQTQAHRSRSAELPRLHGLVRSRLRRVLPARRPGADVGAHQVRLARLAAHQREKRH